MCDSSQTNVIDMCHEKYGNIKEGISSNRLFDSLLNTLCKMCLLYLCMVPKLGSVDTQWDEECVIGQLGLEFEVAMGRRVDRGLNKVLEDFWVRFIHFR